MSGKPGRSGRKRNVRNIQKYYNEQFDLRSSLLIDALLDKAESGEVTALIYAWDRRIGKPKQQTDIGLLDADQLGAGVVTRLMQILYDKSKELKEEEEAKKIALQG